MQQEFSTNEKFSERLRQIRKRMGLTQTQFSKLGGVELGAQQRYEAAKSEPGASYMVGLFDNGIDIMHLLTGQRCPVILEPATAELVSLFEDMPDDLRSALLTFARSMMAHVAQHEVSPPVGNSVHSPPTKYLLPDDRNRG